MEAGGQGSRTATAVGREKKVRPRKWAKRAESQSSRKAKDDEEAQAPDGSPVRRRRKDEIRRAPEVLWEGSRTPR